MSAAGQASRHAALDLLRAVLKRNRPLDEQLAEAMRGLLGELLMGLRPIGIDYMWAQAALLRRLVIRVLVPQLPSAEPVLDNAAGLARLI